MDNYTGPELISASNTYNGRAAGRRSTIVVLYHRLNYLTLGSILVMARCHADKVYVVMDGGDPRIPLLARSVGAETIEKAGNPYIKIFRMLVNENNAEMIIALYGDGTHDPEKISGLIEMVHNGQDVAVCPNSGKYPSDPNDTALLLNNKRRTADHTGIIACSSRCFDVLRSDFIMDVRSDITGQFIDRFECAGLKVRHMDADLSQYNDDLFSLYRIAVVVPAFNEEALVTETLKGIPSYVHKIYAVDDGSTDHTWDAIVSVRDLRIIPIRHTTNKGVGAAIITGYKKALEDNMDIVAVMAGDNQMDPCQLSRLLEPIIASKTDYAKGNRLYCKEALKGMSTWRLLGNAFLTLLTKISSGYWNISDPQNGYTAISHNALSRIPLEDVFIWYGYCNDLLAKMNAYGLRAADIMIPARYGNEKSKIKYAKYIFKVSILLFRNFFWRIKVKYIARDFHPLVFFYIMGILLTLFGISATIWSFMMKLYTNQQLFERLTL